MPRPAFQTSVFWMVFWLDAASTFSAAPDGAGCGEAVHHHVIGAVQEDVVGVAGLDDRLGARAIAVEDDGGRGRAVGRDAKRALIGGAGMDGNGIAGRKRRGVDRRQGL